MAAYPRLPHLIRHLPTAGGLAVALGAAGAVAILSRDTLEHLVWTSGIAALVPAAAPPLGGTARALLVAGGGIVAGAVVWAALFLLIGPGGSCEAWLARIAARPVRRRATACPDAPPRPPMTAADLGTPLMEVGAPPPPAPLERPLPRELDEPLAAFDPGAIPAVPRQPQRVLPALAPGERLDTFDLDPPPPPPVRPAAPAPRREAPPPSIDALLRRLEEGASRKAARA